MFFFSHFGIPYTVRNVRFKCAIFYKLLFNKGLVASQFSLCYVYFNSHANSSIRDFLLGPLKNRIFI